MSTHKHFDKICCVVLALTLIVSVLFVKAERFGVHKVSAVMGYEKTLFDTSKVHTINIIMDDWGEFTENCKSEEYYTCTVIIDNEAYKNVAIRSKGNTSLSQVTNARYSYKIEFDHYDSTNTYYGLDKLCLNNIIQDNTYIKDYLTYQMMNKMGVAAPLCSYAYVTVNGYDWGLYLAVEGVEESFLHRNYGKDYGELYKPDKISMGGGRGNGEKFNMDDFLEDPQSNNSADTDNQTQNDNTSGFPQMPGGMRPPMGGGNAGFGGQFPDGMTPPEGMTPPDGMTPPGGVQGNSPEEGGGGMVKGGDDVLLKYIDDNADSYLSIFENAKTDVSDADKTRLIKALKKLSDGEDIENTVDVDMVIRYFVVHNFVVNFDSYTGSMIHNYYLYEKDGQMQMIPWDYNLAFGGFQSMGGATSFVNYPIDSPVSGGSISDRPMIAWIFEREEYTELYHAYFSEFISTCFDSGYFSEMIDNVNSLISPYVEKDPTKFCTYEAFELGISTLKEFCLLRAESIVGQLNGTIGSTSDTQKSDTLIDAGDIQINNMGSIGKMGGNGNAQKPQLDNDADSGNSSMPQMPGGNMQGGQMPGGFDGERLPPNFANGEDGQQGDFSGQMQRPGMNTQPNGNGQMQPQRENAMPAPPWILIGVCISALAAGLVFAFTYKRRK